MIKHYGFIVKAESYNADHDKAVMDTASFSTNMIGVSSDEQAIRAAQTMIKNGIQVIELCGGFGSESAEKIIARLETNIPIGYVTFSDQERLKLDKLLSQNCKI